MNEVHWTERSIICGTQCTRWSESRRRTFGIGVAKNWLEIMYLRTNRHF